MSILDDLSSAIRSVHESAGPAVVGHRPRQPRQRRRHRRRPRPDQRPQPPRRRGHRHLPRRPQRRAARSLGVDPDGDLAVIEVDTTGATALGLVRRRGRRSATSSSASPRPAPARPASRRARSPPSSRRSAGPAAAGSAAASSTPRRWRPGSSGGPLVDGSGRLLALNTNRIGEGFYLARPGRRRAPRARRRARPRRVGQPAAARHRGRAVDRRPPAAPLGRPAPSVTACWSAASRTAARPTGPGSARATCSSRRPAGR